MNRQELIQLRREKWRLDGRPVRTLEEARDFLESVGLCTMYPVAPALLAPTFVGAWLGSDEDLPSPRRAFADPRAQEATGLMVRLLRERSAYEAGVFTDNSFLLSPSAFPYFYALVGDRTPEKTGPGDKLSTLARDVFLAIQRQGPATKQELRSLLGGGVSEPALDRALYDLWSRLRITRVDYRPRHGASWDVLLRWAPQAVKQGIRIGVAEGLTALVSKYLECVVAAEQQEVEDFFSRFAPRSRVRQALNALLAARELSFVQVGARSLGQVTPPRAPHRPPAAAASRPS
jgi:hypothetical protein